MDTKTLDELRRSFLDDIAAFASFSGGSAGAERQAAIQAYLEGLTPWLTEADSAARISWEFNALPGREELPFSTFGYSYFRAWLRRRGIDPDAVVGPPQPRAA